MKTPIKLKPARAWRTYVGGARICALHGQEQMVSHFPEEWIISTVAARNTGREKFAGEGMSFAQSSGTSLKAFIEKDPMGMLGEKHCKAVGQETGVLVKLIDSAERLTIQVHPDKRAAKTLFDSEFGKTECWHILSGDPVDGVEPCIYFGFRPGITREKWEWLFENQDIDGMIGCLHRFPVKKGDTFLIPGGLPHAIGEGCFLVEIQEPTDLTIRTERVTPAGFEISDFMCHQGLGFQKMFDCFHYQGMTEEEIYRKYYISSRLLGKQAEYHRYEIVGYQDTRCFRLETVEISGTFSYEKGESFSGLYVFSGEGKLTTGKESNSIIRGDQFFVPAKSEPFQITNTGTNKLILFLCYGPKI